MNDKKLDGAKIPSVTIDNYKDIYIACGDSGGSGDDTFVEQIAKREIKELKEELERERTTREELQLQFEKVQRKLDKELNMNFEKSDNQILKLMTKNKALKSQLADIKYLNADEVEKILRTNLGVHFIDNEDESKRFFEVGGIKETTQAICKLAIPDIDNEVGEPVTGKPDLCPIETKDIYYSDVKLCGTGGGAGIGYKPKVDREKIIEVLKDIQKTYGKCFDLIEEEELSTIADEIIKALEGK